MKKNYNYLLFSFIVAFITLLLTSKNSFLYPFNDWVDTNAFFTVGKGWFNGLTPYKDLFEQKGPLLYLIYGFGYLLSHNTFHGVFIIEVLFFTVFLFYIYKIIKLLYDPKYSLFVLPLIAVLVTTMPVFAHGGSCEEFCFPFIAVSLYYYIKHFNKKELSNREIIINGLMAGFVLMMKYTMLGFWIGFGLFIAIYYLLKKDIKNMFKFCGLFLVGMSIPFIIGVIYFAINHGLNDFINVYFKLNMTSYTNAEKFNIFQKVIEIFKYIFRSYKKSYNIIALIVLPLLALITKEKNKIYRLSLVGIIYIAIFFTFFGLKEYIYYHLPVFLLVITVLLIFILQLLKKFIDKVINNKVFLFLHIPLYVILILLTIKFANYNYYLKMKKEDFVQYKYAEYINKYDNPTLLNMGFLDIGVYTMSGVVPNTRFFEVQNIDYDKFKDNIDEMKKYVENKEVKFIVYAKRDRDKEIIAPDYIYNNYEEVSKDYIKLEGNVYTAFLFKLKELE